MLSIWPFNYVPAKATLGNRHQYLITHSIHSLKHSPLSAEFIKLKLKNIDAAQYFVLVFCSPVPFRLPKLLDLSEWELLLPSPADPDFALFPFSRIEMRRNTSSSHLVYCNLTAHIYVLGASRLILCKHKQSQTLIKQLCGQCFCLCVISGTWGMCSAVPTFFGDLPEFKCYCEGLGHCQSHCLSLEDRRKTHFVTEHGKCWPFSVTRKVLTESKKWLAQSEADIFNMCHNESMVLLNWESCTGQREVKTSVSW